MDSIRHLYVHIPFCPAKCSYCAFVTRVGSMKLVAPYMEAVEREVEALGRHDRSDPLATVYLGGGTPSMISPEQFARLLSCINDALGLARDAEITLEAHPDTVDADKLRDFRAAGATRISFGGESLDADQLAILGRSHSVERVFEVVALSRRVGFESINVDLMYGLPGQSVDSWQGSLDRVLSIRPDHLSLYPLSIEPQTVFGRRNRNGLLQIPDDGVVADMYEMACTALRSTGYEHYEIANWAKHNHQSRHNLAYWRNRQFYGVGVAAHGYVKPYRTENLRGAVQYIQAVNRGEDPVSVRDYVDATTELSDTMMLGLRLLKDGIDRAEVLERLGVDLAHVFESDIAELQRLGMLRVSGSRLTLPEDAGLLGNEVWQRFTAR